MSKFNEFTKQIGKICREIETAASMASDDGNTQQYLIEAGCWEDTYRPEFNIIDYLNLYYVSCS